ncbi:hypothetical protein KCG44_12755 [Pacificimonas sp. WHA3]|uniref:5-bromo-4-chloroindolyl phosphate hydrolysis protein n=1 Tax=Pacificimonas pallii TaxID=2827236 RepID=A0ABS6SHD2_9SPHN|nr:hypothetical protein [Pacificimonas pallii]MBV7257655.1 hypothetical protein [Pacificimonas pallii]
MVQSVDQVLAKFDDITARADRQLRELRQSDAGRAAARRMEARERSPWLTKLKRSGMAVAGVAVAALILAMIIGGIGIDGFILLVLALGAAALVPLFLPLRGAAKKEPEPTVDNIINAELGALPVRVERWLAARRHELPAPARIQVDELLLRLEILAPQLEKVEADAPVVTDARRLIGDELPRLVTSYVDVPLSYREVGGEADTKLREGLATISNELKRLSEQLARGDLDRLAIEGRFLEIKYKDGESAPGM